MDANNIHLSSGFDLYGKQESVLEGHKKVGIIICSQMKPTNLVHSTAMCGIIKGSNLSLKQIHQRLQRNR